MFIHQMNMRPVPEFHDLKRYSTECNLIVFVHVGEIAQQIRGTCAKLGAMCSILGTHMVGGENRTQRVIL